MVNHFAMNQIFFKEKSVGIGCFNNLICSNYCCCLTKSSFLNKQEILNEQRKYWFYPLSEFLLTVSNLLRELKFSPE